MNKNHDLCASPEWAGYLQREVLPEVTRDVDLGQRMLEVGPGPGAATEWLRHRVAGLVAVESDEDAAARLVTRFEGTNVEVVTGDATEMTFDASSFDAAGSFTMLHHVPKVAQQDLLFSEVFRVLRPGGVFVGTDSLPSDALRLFHQGDTYNPIQPEWLMTTLPTIGFERVTVAADGLLTFIAYKPVAGELPT